MRKTTPNLYLGQSFRCVIWFESWGAKMTGKTTLRFCFVFDATNTTSRSFISYRTGQYKLHYYETPTSIKFVMLTDTQSLNMRNVLHQIYVNLYVEFGISFHPCYAILITDIYSGEESPFSNRASWWRRSRKRIIRIGFRSIRKRRIIGHIQQFQNFESSISRSVKLYKMHH